MTTFVLGPPLVGVSADRPITPGDDYSAPFTIIGTSGSFDVAGWGLGVEADEPDLQPYGQSFWVDFMPPEPGTLVITGSGGYVLEAGAGADLESWTVSDSGTDTVSTVVGSGSPVRVRIRFPAAVETASFSWTFTDLVPDLVLNVLSDLVQAPGTFRVTVTNGVPGEDVTFTDSESDTIIGGTLDENGALISFAIGISSSLAAGTYTLTASSTDRDDATADFIVTNSPFDDPLGQPADTDAVAVDPVDGVQKWVLQDPAPGGEQYVFDINPDSATSPFGANVFTTDQVTAPDGQFLVWEGARRSVDWSFKGTLLTQDQYHAFQRFAALNRRVYLIDHRNRAWVISVEFFDPTPRKVNQNPWAHDYTMNVAIYKGPLTPVTP